MDASLLASPCWTKISLLREASIQINYCKLQSLTNNTVNKPSRKINFQNQIHLTERGGEKVMTVTYKHVALYLTLTLF